MFFIFFIIQHHILYLRNTFVPGPTSRIISALGFGDVCPELARKRNIASFWFSASQRFPISFRRLPHLLWLIFSPLPGSSTVDRRPLSGARADSPRRPPRAGDAAAPQHRPSVSALERVGRAWRKEAAWPWVPSTQILALTRPTRSSSHE